MSILYIYDPATMQLLARVHGEDNKEMEDKAEEHYCSNDYANTYSPAFGFSGGLIDNPKAEDIYVKS